MSISDSACGCARCFASLRPDGELADIQEKFLAFHLSECSSCRAYAEAVAGTTTAVRTAPLLDAPKLRVVRPSRRRFSARALPTVAAAVVAATAGLAGLAGVQPQQDDSPSLPAPRPAYLDSATYEQALIEDLRRAPAPEYPGSRIAT
jgi:predicted anti-sigma-YlaC factor YlaD